MSHIFSEYLSFYHDQYADTSSLAIFAVGSCSILVVLLVFLFMVWSWCWYW